MPYGLWTRKHLGAANACQLSAVCEGLFPGDDHAALGVVGAHVALVTTSSLDACASMQHGIRLSVWVRTRHQRHVHIAGVGLSRKAEPQHGPGACAPPLISRHLSPAVQQPRTPWHRLESVVMPRGRRARHGSACTRLASGSGVQACIATGRFRRRRGSKQWPAALHVRRTSVAPVRGGGSSRSVALLAAGARWPGRETAAAVRTPRALRDLA